MRRDDGVFASTSIASDALVAYSPDRLDRRGHRCAMRELHSYAAATQECAPRRQVAERQAIRCRVATARRPGRGE